MMFEISRTEWNQNKKELLAWFDENWTYDSFYSSILWNILLNIKLWIEAK